MKFFAIKTLIFSVVLTSFSFPVSAQSNVQKPQIPLAGTYYAQGTMFNHSRREIARRGDRMCIKIVNGPPNPYRGVEAITISSLSLKGGKLYVDANSRELIIENNGRAFSDGMRALWEHRNGSPDSRSQPLQAQKMAECLSARRVYVHQMQGISIPGTLELPNSREQ